MSQQQPIRISRYLHEYRKKLSLLKVKSFYANHLCKRNCLEGKLQNIAQPCFNQCDQWLKNFYQLKKEKTPEEAQSVLYQVQKKYENALKDATPDFQFQKAHARAKHQIGIYLDTLEQFLNRKIELENKTKK